MNRSESNQTKTRLLIYRYIAMHCFNKNIIVLSFFGLWIYDILSKTLWLQQIIQLIISNTSCIEGTQLGTTIKTFN